MFFHPKLGYIPTTIIFSRALFLRDYDIKQELELFNIVWYSQPINQLNMCVILCLISN